MDLLLDETRSRITSSSSLSAGSSPVDNCPSTPDSKCRWDTVESGVGEHVATRGVPITPTYQRGGQANNNILEECSPGMSRRQSSEASCIGGGGRSEAVPQECTRPPSYSPRNQRRETSSTLSRPESNAEIINVEDPPKASQERPILANPPFTPHPELFSGKEMGDGIMRTRAGVISSCDNEVQEATGHGDGWKPCTGADVSDLAVQQVHLPETAAVATPENQATTDSTNGSLAGLTWKHRGEEEPSTESGSKRLPGTILTRQDFGLRNWKEYAALRHGSNPRFSESPHGREILLKMASTIREQEVNALKHELKEARVLAEEFHSALQTEQADKAKLQSRVFFLEGEVEKLDLTLRARDTVDLEISELRRRHNVEISKNQSRIEKMELETKELEAERDGYRRAAETQAELLSGGFSELRGCLEDIKTRPRSQSVVDPNSADGVQDVGASMAPTADASVHMMRATEEGLHQQVRTLQSLLLEAVAAAVPTVIMPSTVKAAVDSIRQGMGLIPQEWAPECPSSVVGSQCVVNDEYYLGEESTGETLTLTLQCLGVCKGGSEDGGDSSPETTQLSMPITRRSS